MARTKTQTAQETPVSEERPTRGAVAVRARNAQMTGIDTLIPYAHNARTHSPEQLMRLRESLRAFGFVQPILIDEERNVLAGHGRLAAARAEGMRQVPCVVVTGLTEAERRAYILADNRLAELAGWGYPMRAPWHRRAARCARLGAWSVHITRRTAPGRRI